MDLPAFAIVAPPEGSPTVAINGHPVDAAAWSVHMEPGDQHPTLTVATTGPASSVTGHGIVHLVDGDQAATIQAWLDGIDSAALEQLALTQLHGLDPARTAGDAWLRALKAIAADA